MLERILERTWTPTPEDLITERAYIRNQIKEIGAPAIQKMVSIAADFRNRAYAPYSNYHVGAALLTTGQEIYGGANAEGVNYSTTTHAEGNAIAQAENKGAAQPDRKFIKAITVCHEGDSGPCGECLQRLVEHCDNCLVVVANPKGEIVRITSLKTIFPYNFNPSHLGK